MEGVGTLHAITQEPRIIGRLVAGHSVLLDRTCPLAAQVGRQKKGCESEAVVFQMETFIRPVEPVVRTRTHGLWDR